MAAPVSGSDEEWPMSTKYGLTSAKNRLVQNSAKVGRRRQRLGWRRLVRGLWVIEHKPTRDEPVERRLPHEQVRHTPQVDRDPHHHLHHHRKNVEMLLSHIYKIRQEKINQRKERRTLAMRSKGRHVLKSECADCQATTSTYFGSAKRRLRLAEPVTNLLEGAATTSATTRREWQLASASQVAGTWTSAQASNRGRVKPDSNIQEGCYYQFRGHGMTSL